MTFCLHDLPGTLVRGDAEMRGVVGELECGDLGLGRGLLEFEVVLIHDYYSFLTEKRLSRSTIVMTDSHVFSLGHCCCDYLAASSLRNGVR